MVSKPTWLTQTLDLGIRKFLCPEKYSSSQSSGISAEDLTAEERSSNWCFCTTKKRELFLVESTDDSVYETRCADLITTIDTTFSPEAVLAWQEKTNHKFRQLPPGTRFEVGSIELRVTDCFIPPRITLHVFSFNVIPGDVSPLPASAIPIQSHFSTNALLQKLLERSRSRHMFTSLTPLPDSHIALASQMMDTSVSQPFQTQAAHSFPIPPMLDLLTPVQAPLSPTQHDLRTPAEKTPSSPKPNSPEPLDRKKRLDRISEWERENGYLPSYRARIPTDQKKLLDLPSAWQPSASERKIGGTVPLYIMNDLGLIRTNESTGYVNHLQPAPTGGEAQLASHSPLGRSQVQVEQQQMQEESVDESDESSDSQCLPESEWAKSPESKPQAKPKIADDDNSDDDEPPPLPPPPPPAFQSGKPDTAEPMVVPPSSVGPQISSSPPTHHHVTTPPTLTPPTLTPPTLHELGDSQKEMGNETSKESSGEGDKAKAVVQSLPESQLSQPSPTSRKPSASIQVPNSKEPRARPRLLPLLSTALPGDARPFDGASAARLDGNVEMKSAPALEAEISVGDIQCRAPENQPTRKRKRPQSDGPPTKRTKGHDPFRQSLQGLMMPATLPAELARRSRREYRSGISPSITSSPAERHWQNRFGRQSTSSITSLGSPAPGGLFLRPDLYRSYCSTYPDYAGQENQFSTACKELMRNNGLGTLHQSLWDDYIFRRYHNYQGYRDYVQQATDAMDEVEPFMEFYSGFADNGGRDGGIVTRFTLLGENQDFSPVSAAASAASRLGSRRSSLRPTGSYFDKRADTVTEAEQHPISGERRASPITHELIAKESVVVEQSVAVEKSFVVQEPPQSARLEQRDPSPELGASATLPAVEAQGDHPASSVVATSPKRPTVTKTKETSPSRLAKGSPSTSKRHIPIAIPSRPQKSSSLMSEKIRRLNDQADEHMKRFLREGRKVRPMKKVGAG